MQTHHLKGMVRALRPVLKDCVKGEQILEKYWTDKRMIVWEIKDVHRAANERNLVLRNDEARNILNKLMDGYNAQHGITWGMLLEIIDNTCPGRNITRQELKRFLEQGIIAIQKKQ